MTRSGGYGPMPIPDAQPPSEAPDGGSTDSSDMQMRLRYAGVCRLCGTTLPARTHAVYERTTKSVRCVACPTSSAPDEGQDEAASAADAEPGPEAAAEPESDEIDRGVAGSSARREYERRKARDEERLRQKWGRLGGIAVALSDEKQSTTAWATGAVGEEQLGARLESLVCESIAVLHDRRIPGTKANIDHIVVTRAGVWVVDAKHYKGRPELKVEGGLFRPRVERLVVGGRDCTKLVEGVLKQVALVQAVAGDVPVNGALCFVGADWPLFGGAFTTRGVHVLWPNRLEKTLLDETGSDIDVAGVRASLAGHFKAA